MFYRITAAFLLFVSGVFAYGQSGQVLLGVLEDLPGHYAGDPNFRAVRITFQKDKSGWQAADSRQSLREVIWTIAFDGKKLGSLTGRATKEHRYSSEVGLQEITSGDPVPTIGHRSSDYSGFLETPVFRPLIADSKPFFSDPAMWKPTQVPSQEITLLRLAFRRKFPKLCKETKPEVGPLEPFAYKDDDVSVLKTYSSKAGWTVARLHLEAIDCGDTEAGFNIDDPWFVVSPQKEVAYLDSGMWLVDAGDYDNDGKSEVVFSIDRYNRGGYEIFYDDFSRHAVFEFGYH